MSTDPTRLSAPLPSSEPVEAPASYSTTTFVDLLRQLNLSLAVTTYQAGKLAFLRPEKDRLNMHFRSFERPMGMAVRHGRLALGTGIQVWEFANVPAVAAKVEPIGRVDGCFLPRRSHVTGAIDIHEMGYAGDGDLWFVNTRFSCLCTLHPNSSFVPRWRPPWVTKLAPEDRCHLNGLGVHAGYPRWVTALGATDTEGGWRPGKARGGVLYDLIDRWVVLDELSMPHSPRWHDGRLWLAESGDGSLGYVDPAGPKFVKVCELPGFTRGLDFAGQVAFVGLSQVRESVMFAGLPLTERLTERVCGVYAVHIGTGAVLGYMRFTAGVQEVFAVQCLPGMTCPDLLNESTDLLKHAYVLPEEAMGDAVVPGRRPA